MRNSIKKVGLLTSGGDAPGMNAVIRAVVRSAIYNDICVVGIKKGYEGLLNCDIMELNQRNVSDILHVGGTMLRTARCEEMKTKEGQERAYQICKVLGLDALVIVGGDGSLKGAYLLSKLGLNVIGIPATIDLDFACSDYTIGFDTAVTTAMEAIGKIKNTSSSHERCSVVEVMGRDAGYIALWCALTSGAEEILIPEKKDITEDDVIKQIIQNRAKGKRHNLIIVAEGTGGSQDLARKIESITGIETRATILGHLQRGGSPSAVDRMHASMMGYRAIEILKDGKENRVVVVKNGKYEDINIEETLDCSREYDSTLYDIIKILSI